MSKSKRAAALALALGSALALSGCGGTNVAASVDGRVITEDSARIVTEQIRKNFGENVGDFQTPSAVSYLIMAPFMIDAAAEAGIPVSEQEARAALTEISDPAPETVEVVRANAAIGALQQTHPEALQKASEKMAAAKISVNPRYGAFDIATGQMSAKTPNWIAGSGQEPAADGSQEPATDGSGGTQEPTPAG